jgi:hypothetical protein
MILQVFAVRRHPAMSSSQMAADEEFSSGSFPTTAR